MAAVQNKHQNLQLALSRLAPHDRKPMINRNFLDYCAAAPAGRIGPSSVWWKRWQVRQVDSARDPVRSAPWQERQFSTPGIMTVALVSAFRAAWHSSHPTAACFP
jgi:hypothetical protein